nr:nucleotide-binding alpha-beta plait domain-containing protein [Tanacetum cinerariifolium]
MSYVNVVNWDTKSTEACEPSLLLDESCLNQLDYSLGLLGKDKEFSSFDNMRMVLGNEGFNDIDVTPPDGAWTEYVSGGVTLLRISSTKHKERPLR